MIFVQPAYLPSVNYFKDFNDKRSLELNDQKCLSI